MKPVSDGFLLNMAEVTGALIGLFLVGVFFYADTGFQRLGAARELVVAYFRASTRIVLILFAIPLALSLSLVVLEPAWSAVLFAFLSLSLIAANVDTAIRIGPVQGVTRSPMLLANEVVGSAAVAVLVVVPWLLGGLDPSREDLTWAILIAFAAAFLSLVVTVLWVFDIATAHAQSAEDAHGRSEGWDRRYVYSTRGSSSSAAPTRARRRGGDPR